MLVILLQKAQKKGPTLGLGASGNIRYCPVFRIKSKHNSAEFSIEKIYLPYFLLEHFGYLRWKLHCPFVKSVSAFKDQIYSGCIHTKYTTGYGISMNWP